MIVDGSIETYTWTYFIRMLCTNDIVTNAYKKGQSAILVNTPTLINYRALTTLIATSQH